MRNLARILCGLLTFSWFECLVAPRAPEEKVFLEPAPGHLSVKPHHPTLLQLIGLSFNTWGSKTRLAPESGQRVEKIDETHVFGQAWKHVFGKHDVNDVSDKLESASMTARLKHRLASSGYADILFLLGVAMFLLVLLVCMMVGGESDEPSSDESECKSEPRDLQSPTVAGIDAGTQIEARTQDDPIHQVEFSDGSWARAFREARGQRKEALELLFRCNIISTQEFAYSRVSQEHIDECAWIGTYMLKQKPLEEWVALWQQAQQTFEDSVTACFTARTDARSTYEPMSGTAPRSEIPLLDCHTAASQAEDDNGGPCTTRSSLGSLRSPDSAYRLEEALGSAREMGRSSTPPNVQEQRILSPMILRCREIMQAPPQEGVPAQRSLNPLLRAPASATFTQAPVVGAGFMQSEESISPSLAPSVPSVMDISPSMPELSPVFPPTAPFLLSSTQSISPAMQSISPSLPSISPSMPSISPSIPTRSPPEMTTAPGIQAAMVAPLSRTLPVSRQDSGGASRTIGGSLSPSFSSLPPQPMRTVPTREQSGTVIVKTLAESHPEILSAQSTMAPSSSQASPMPVGLPAAVMHGMVGQVKPPPERLPSDGEVLVAHVAITPPGGSASPVQMSPLMQQREREDRFYMS